MVYLWLVTQRNGQRSKPCFMKRLRILSVCYSLLICVSVTSGCATTGQGSSQSQETEQKSYEVSGNRLNAFWEAFFSILQSVAYGIGQSGYSFKP